eukprot:gene16671-22927_t
MSSSSAPSPCPLPPFKLERYFAKYEFTAPYLMCCSDCQPLKMKELLSMADQETASMWEDLSLGYTETPGLLALREEAAKQLFSSVNKDQIVVLAPEEGVYLTMRALLKPGDVIVCMYPGYQSLYEIGRSIGCQVVFWEPELQHGGKIIFSVDKLQGIVRNITKRPTLLIINTPHNYVKKLGKDVVRNLPKRPAMLIVNTPHNPTGFQFSKEAWQGVVGIARSIGCYLFSDEMYRLLELSSTHRLPAAADVYPRGISLMGMSKSFSLPGLRIGMIACKDAGLIHRIQELKDWTTICPPAPSELLALIALRSHKRIVDANLAIIRKNVLHTQRFMQHFSHAFEWEEPIASSVAFPSGRSSLLFVSHILGEPIDAFCERVVQGCGVLLLPSTVYDHPASAERGYFRIGLGRSNFPECLKVLWKFLESDKGLSAWRQGAVFGFGHIPSMW